MSLAFHIDEWIAADGVATPELRATWARLRITVDGCAVSELRDDAAGASRDALYIPLYPLAEWIAANWFTLLNEPESPGRSTERDFWRRHCVRAAAEGFALPELRIVTEGDTTLLRWLPVSFLAQRLRFVANGEARVGRSAVEEALRNLVDAVILRLRDGGVPSTNFLEEEWAAVASLDQEEADFCATVAAMGLDPFNVDAEIGGQVLRIARDIQPDLRSEFFAAANPAQLPSQFDWLRFATQSVSDSDSIDIIPDLRREWARQSSQERGGTGHEPWDVGYRAANAVRNYVGLSVDPIPTEDFRERLGFAQSKTNSQAHSENMDAVAVSLENYKSAIVLTNRSNIANRFAFARALYESFTHPTGDALVTRAASTRQKANRAFAAELLAPAEGLRRRLPMGLPSSETFEDLADEFGVSTETIRYQLWNHGLAQLSV